MIMRKLLFWALLAAYCCTACQNDGDDGPVPLEYPVTFNYDRFVHEPTVYAVVEDNGYTVVQPTDQFKLVVDSTHAGDWVEFVGNEGVQQVVLNSADSATLSWSFIGIDSLVTAGANYSIDGEVLRLDIGDSQEALFPYDESIGELSYCEISYYYASEHASGATEYLGFFSSPCQDIVHDDLLQGGINNYGFESGDTVAMIQTAFILQRE